METRQRPTQRGEQDGFAFVEQKDRLQILHAGKPLADYVFRDPEILRPLFFQPENTEWLAGDPKSSTSAR